MRTNTSSSAKNKKLVKTGSMASYENVKDLKIKEEIMEEGEEILRDIP